MVEIFLSYFMCEVTSRIFVIEKYTITDDNVIYEDNSFMILISDECQIIPNSTKNS